MIRVLFCTDNLRVCKTKPQSLGFYFVHTVYVYVKLSSGHYNVLFCYIITSGHKPDAGQDTNHCHNSEFIVVVAVAVAVFVVVVVAFVVIFALI